jgi:hypothetical protein
MIFLDWNMQSYWNKSWVCLWKYRELSWSKEETEWEVSWGIQNRFFQALNFLRNQAFIRAEKKSFPTPTLTCPKLHYTERPSSFTRCTKDQCSCIRWNLGVVSAQQGWGPDWDICILKHHWSMQLKSKKWAIYNLHCLLPCGWSNVPCKIDIINHSKSTNH